VPDRHQVLCCAKAMGMSFYWVALGVLAVWRVTHLLNAESGPWDVLARVRRRAGAGVWGSLLSCFYCLSLWVAAPFACWLGERWKERVMLWLSFSGAAILLERVTAQEGEIPPAAYAEDEEEKDVLR